MFNVSLRSLMEAGVHFGHQTRRWNPKMKSFIFGAKNGVHIIDRDQTMTALKRAHEFLGGVLATGDSVLLVGTKRQAQPIVQQLAVSTSMPYVINRWLGGMLTNFHTLRASVERLEKYEAMLANQAESGRTKKELTKIGKEVTKLRHNLGGIVQMKRLHGALFVTDANVERIAINEANRLGIPVVAIVDTNCNPDNIDYVIPGNDDAIKSLEVFTGAIAAAINDGKRRFEERIQADARERALQEKKGAAEAKEKAKAEAQKPKDPKAPMVITRRAGVLKGVDLEEGEQAAE